MVGEVVVGVVGDIYEFVLFFVCEVEFVFDVDCVG